MGKIKFILSVLPTKVSQCEEVVLQHNASRINEVFIFPNLKIKKSKMNISFNPFVIRLFSFFLFCFRRGRFLINFLKLKISFLLKPKCPECKSVLNIEELEHYWEKQTCSCGYVCYSRFLDVGDR